MSCRGNNRRGREGERRDMEAGGALVGSGKRHRPSVGCDARLDLTERRHRQGRWRRTGRQREREEVEVPLDRALQVGHGLAVGEDVHRQLLQAGRTQGLLGSPREISPKQVRHGAGAVGGVDDRAIAVDPDGRDLAAATPSSGAPPSRGSGRGATGRTYRGQAAGARPPASVHLATGGPIDLRSRPALPPSRPRGRADRPTRADRGRRRRGKRSRRCGAR